MHEENESAGMSCARPTRGALALHLLRGCCGVAAIAGALWLAPQQPWLALGLGLFALVLWRGCPMCWTLGLIETLAARKAK